MTNKHSILIPEAVYHVYNRANGNEKLFLSVENYRYFLQKYKEHISPIADTFCYCLMPNHFHFLIRVKSEEELKDFFESKSKHKASQVDNELEGFLDPQGFKNLEGLNKKPQALITNSENLEILLSNQFSIFFNAYAKAFNKMYDRKGSLFMHPYKRKQVTDDAYLHQLVQYIHYNPIESGLTSKLADWEHCSYKHILSGQHAFLNIKEIINWYDNLENFKHVHEDLTEQIVIE